MRRNDGDVQVVVTEGKVRVDLVAGVLRTDGSARPNGAPTDDTQLAAGTIAHVSEAGVLVQTRPLAEAEEALSWRDGVLVFHEMTLAEASAELRVAGHFRANNVDAFARLLERGYPVRVDEREDELVLKAR